MEQFFSKVGDVGRVVQVDEIAVARDRIITNSTSAEDSIRDTTWLVGGIEEDGEERIFINYPRQN